MATYPGGIYSPRTKNNKDGVVYTPANLTTLYAEDVVYDDAEIVAIETELGTNPKGAKADVKTRLDDVDSLIATKISKTIAGELAAMTAMTDLVNDDVFLLEDNSESNAKRKTLWSSIKAVLKTYFDGLYLAVTGGVFEGELKFEENTFLTLKDALSADGKFCGIVEAGVAGVTLVFGNLCYFNNDDSRWELVDANESDGYDKKLGICILAAAGNGNTTIMLLYGKIRADAAFPDLTIGAPVYMAEVAGDIVVAQPTTADVCIRIIGFANTANELFFNPSNDYIIHG